MAHGHLLDFPSETPSNEDQEVHENHEGQEGNQRHNNNQNHKDHKDQADQKHSRRCGLRLESRGGRRMGSRVPNER